MADGDESSVQLLKDVLTQFPKVRPCDGFEEPDTLDGLRALILPKVETATSDSALQKVCDDFGQQLRVFEALILGCKNAKRELAGALRSHKALQARLARSAAAKAKAQVKAKARPKPKAKPKGSPLKGADVVAECDLPIHAYEFQNDAAIHTYSDLASYISARDAGDVDFTAPFIIKKGADFKNMKALRHKHIFQQPCQ